MSLAKRLFRESALERLASPEQLDQQLTVTSARSWVALAAIWALLGAVIAWPIVGSVPTKEAGQGIIVTGGGLRVVEAAGTGRLRRIMLGVDQPVSRGQVVAEIDKQEIQDELEETATQLAELRAQHVRITALDGEEEKLQKELAEVETQRLHQTITYADERKERLASQRTVTQELVDQGMMTEIDVLKLGEEIEEARLEKEKAKLEIQQLLARNLEASVKRQRDHMTREFEIEKLQSTADMLQSKLLRESQVVSQFDGTVVELRAAEQTVVSYGDAIMLIEPAETEAGKLEAIMFVSAGRGKRIEPGMVVHVSPSTIKREEHGSMIGEVASIAYVPTSKAAMMAVLKDADLVEKFRLEIGVPFQMQVALKTDPSTPSGYAWTSAEGPPTLISAGTLCSGSVTVKEQRPVELLLPYLKRKLGGDR